MPRKPYWLKRPMLAVNVLSGAGAGAGAAAGAAAAGAGFAPARCPRQTRQPRGAKRDGTIDCWKTWRIPCWMDERQSDERCFRRILSISCATAAISFVNNELSDDIFDCTDARTGLRASALSWCVDGGLCTAMGRSSAVASPHLSARWPTATAMRSLLDSIAPFSRKDERSGGSHAEQQGVRRSRGPNRPGDRKQPRQGHRENVRAMLSSGLARLDVVPRAEFDVQAQVLLKTREKLEALEARLAEIEKRLPAGKTE